MPTRLLISPAFIILPSLLLIQSFGLEYIVGDSFWSIPTTNDFYTNWSSSHIFHTADTLYFDFDSGLHNVMEVSRREYESCSADNPFKVFWDGPASVALVEEGVFYFVCSIANYCALGQKLSVAVHSEKNSPHSAPTSSQRPPKSSQPSPDASKMPPSAMTPSSSQAPTSMTDLSVSLVTVKSAGDQCCNDAVSLGWLSLFGLLFHFI